MNVLPAKAKIVIGWLLFAFLVYAIATHPDRFGTVIRSVWDFGYAAIAGVGVFFSTIIT
jgi:hypothetical protein